MSLSKKRQSNKKVIRMDLNEFIRPDDESIIKVISRAMDKYNKEHILHAKEIWVSRKTFNRLMDEITATATWYVNELSTTQLFGCNVKVYEDNSIFIR